MGRCKVTKTIVQCDFDGTITEKDVSFLILDAYTNGDWQQYWDQYLGGEISVGAFNTRAFAMVKADEQTLLNFIKSRVKIRPGFDELLACCQKKGFQFAIVSNGLEFYIKAILKDLGVADIEVFAAQTRFGTGGIDVRYIGPQGDRLEASFKEAYVRLFRDRGYRVVYIGNGASDLPPARQSHQVFAIGDLLNQCKNIKLDCTPFADLNDVTKVLELM